MGNTETNMKNGLLFKIEGILSQLQAGDIKIFESCALPSSLDLKISDMVGLFADLPAAEKDEICASITSHQAGILLTFARRMAALAVRENSKGRIFEGLIAVGLHNSKYGDFRDEAVALSLLNNSALKTESNPIDLFETAANTFTNSAGDIFKAFLKRKPENKKIDAMGYREIYKSDGFAYERLPLGG